jgi:hypothetical protein
VQCALVLHSWQVFFVVSQNLVGIEQSLSALHCTHLLAGERQIGVAPVHGSAVPHLHTPVVHLLEFNLQLVSTVHCLQVNVVMSQTGVAPKQSDATEQATHVPFLHFGVAPEQASLAPHLQAFEVHVLVE